MKPLDHVQHDYDTLSALVQTVTAERDRLNSILAERIARRDAYQEELADTKLWVTITPEEREKIANLPPEAIAQGANAFYRSQLETLQAWGLLDNKGFTRLAELVEVYKRRGAEWCAPTVPSPVDLYRLLLAVAEKLACGDPVQRVDLRLDMLTNCGGAPVRVHGIWVNGEPCWLIDFGANGSPLYDAMYYPDLLPYRNDYAQTVVTLHRLVCGG